MSSTLQYFKKDLKNGVADEKNSLTKKEEINLKITKLKNNLFYYSTILEKEKMIKDIEVNKLKKEKK